MNIRGRVLLVTLAAAMAACETDDGCQSTSLHPLSGCSSGTPEAAAGPDKYVVEGDTVELTNFAFNFSGVSSSWAQLSGPQVTLSDAKSTTATFIAPPVDVTTALEFRLTARSGSGKKQRDSITVWVEPTTESALCADAPLFSATYVWTNNTCTTDSADIAGDSRVVTLFRQVEVEPNDEFATANPLQLPSSIAGENVATSVSGSIGSTSRDAADFVALTPNVQGDYRIALCNDPIACTRGTVTLDWNLVIYDQNNNRVANTSSGVLSERSLVLRLNAGSIYYVAILSNTADRTDWDYNLTISQN